MDISSLPSDLPELYKERDRIIDEKKRLLVVREQILKKSKSKSGEKKNKGKKHKSPKHKSVQDEEMTNSQLELGGSSDGENSVRRPRCTWSMEDNMKLLKILKGGISEPQEIFNEMAKLPGNTKTYEHIRNKRSNLLHKATAKKTTMDSILEEDIDKKTLRKRGRPRKNKNEEEDTENTHPHKKQKVSHKSSSKTELVSSILETPPATPPETNFDIKTQIQKIDYIKGLIKEQNSTIQTLNDNIGKILNIYGIDHVTIINSDDQYSNHNKIDKTMSEQESGEDDDSD